MVSIRRKRLKIAAEKAAAKSSASPQMEKTFIMIKPDGVQRGLVGEIIRRFEKKGLTLKSSKLITADPLRAELQYAHLGTKPFFNGLVEFITSGPVVAMVWEGENVVATTRKLIGATNPTEAAPGTIRGDYAVDIARNLIHGSRNVWCAEREIALWFRS